MALYYTHIWFHSIDSPYDKLTNSSQTGKIDKKRRAIYNTKVTEAHYLRRFTWEDIYEDKFRIDI